MGSTYRRRKGCDWENSLYEKLLEYIIRTNIDEKTVSILISADIKSLAMHIYPQNGHRKIYQENLVDFLERNSETIIKDCIDKKEGIITNFTAPKLKLWIEYKNKIIAAMTDKAIKKDVNKYIKNNSFVLGDKTKKFILNKIYNIQGPEYDDDIKKKLKNALQNNRAEICEGIKGLIEDDSCDSDGNSLDGMLFVDNDSEKNNGNKENSSNNGNKENSSNNNLQNMCSDKKKKISKNSNDDKKKTSRKITIDMIQFTYPKSIQNNTDEQVYLIEKLIILSLLQKNNIDLNKFMNDARVSYTVKKNILEIVYSKVEEFHYVILDLAYQYRYIAKQKVNEYKELFKSNGIITTSNVVTSKLLFRHAEEVFYKVLYQINDPTQTISVVIEEYSQSKEFFKYIKNKKRDEASLTVSTLELSIVDALATFVVLDLCILDIHTHKITSKILDPIINSSDFKKKVNKCISSFLNKNENTMKVAAELVNIIKIYLPDVNNYRQKLIQQIAVYLNILELGSGVVIQPCFRYSKENYVGAKVCSTKMWPKNSVLKNLTGYLSTLNHEEVKYLTENDLDFSVLLNESNQNLSLWLGPGSFVNHDCNANTEFYYCKRKNEICLRAVRMIKPGEEITCSYGETYFTKGECECLTCKK